MGETIIRINGRAPGRRPRVGLALSGGGVRGLAHIGVLKVLVENRIPIDMVSGTSAGAIIAAMYASGYKPLQMQALAENLNVSDLIDLKVTVGDLFKHGMKWLFSGKFRFWSVLPTGLVKGDKVEQYLTGLLYERTFKDTVVPLAITSVDINSGDTVFFITPPEESRVILNARYYTNALLTEAVRASISVPGIFFPKKYRGMLLVDGAVKNNLPTDILRHMGAEVILAVDLGYSGQPVPEIKTVGEILLQCIDIMGREVTLLKGEPHASVVIRPEVYDLSFKDTKQVSLCVAKGAQAAWAQIPEIRRLTSG
ncbi:MAG TPA: patatin-like phospholipase family protein [Selenomonadales bacterium]|nr:patatin-like phospholipase family protein [Selenomonadales bacterium]